jgi:hypothetical protein
LRLHRPDPAIICCYTELHPLAEGSLLAYAPGTEFIRMAGPYAYRDAIRQHWTGVRDLVVIEQDIQITDRVIPSFRKRCRHDWCVFSYQGPPANGHLYRSLGCTKFSAKLQREHPFESFNTDAMTWKFVDVQIAALLWYEHKISPHVHGHVTHHHDYATEIAAMSDDIPWFREMHIDGSYANVCKELQPDGQTFVYHVNEDGSRGRFKRIIPPMPRYSNVPA